MSSEPGHPVDSRESAAVSRPSLTNRADATNHRDSAGDGESVSEAEERLPPILASFREEFGDLVNMAISVVPTRKLRREVTREIRGQNDGTLKSRTVRAAMKEFLKWYLEQENSQLVLENQEGEEVTTPLPNSYSDEYGRQWYGRLKDIEREFVRNAPEPHTAMLSLTASTTTAEGEPRPPGDHLRGLQETWSPYVRRELQRALDEAGFGRYNEAVNYEKANAIGYVLDGEVAAAKWWEYVTVVEPHGGGGDATGYGHFHVGVFASHEVEEELFHPVVRKHVEKCEHAGREAHNLFHPEEEKRPVSVNEVDPESEPEGEEIGNLGSYLSEYIGGFSEELEERPMHELVFQATCWATGTQRVRASVGANELAREGRVRRAREGETEIPSASGEWTPQAIENVESGERRPPALGGSSYLREIHVEGEALSRSLDPPG